MPALIVLNLLFMVKVRSLYHLTQCTYIKNQVHVFSSCQYHLLGLSLTQSLLLFYSRYQNAHLYLSFQYMYVFLCASLYGLFSTYLDVPLSLSALNAALLSFVSVFRLWYGLPFNYLHRSFVSLYFGLSVRPFLFLSLSLFIDWSFQFVAGSSSPTAATFSPVK